jgi:hypothetical protein
VSLPGLACKKTEAETNIAAASTKAFIVLIFFLIVIVLSPSSSLSLMDKK